MMWMPLQTTDVNCGSACLDYALQKLFGRAVSQRTIDEVTSNAEDGTSHAGLVEGAHKMGLTVTEFMGDLDTLKKIMYDAVVIVGWTWPPKDEHYSILEEINENTVILNDQVGFPFKLIIDREEFIKHWRDSDAHRWALVLGK